MEYTNGKGKIISSKEVAPAHFLIEIETPFALSDAKPGKFVMIRVSDGLSPVLRRPFGIYNVNEKINSFEVLVRVVGEGTRLLSEMSVGTSLEILGPLGNGFDLDIAGDAPLLVAGGVGVAPLFTLAEALISKGKKVKILVGGREKKDLLVIEDLKEIGAEVLSVTEDGSEGFKGFVTDLMTQIIKSEETVTSIYSCGPHLMLKKVGEIALENKLTCQLSLEAIMACGFGVCLGCVIKSCSKDEEKEFDYSRVCCEGPVFNAEEVIW